MSSTNYVIGITGPSGSGKSSLIQSVRARYSPEQIKYLQTDHYYLNHSNLTFDERAKLNYDSPSAIDIQLLSEHIQALKQGHAIAMPEYDFATHARTTKITHLEPAPIILLDGILLLAIEEIRTHIDHAIFLNTPLDLCFMRRLERDCLERSRTVESVIQQYLQTVRPMLFEHILPSKNHAHTVFPMGGRDQHAIDQLDQIVEQRFKAHNTL